MKWKNKRPAVYKGTAVLAFMLAVSSPALPAAAADAAAGTAAGSVPAATTDVKQAAPDTASSQTAPMPGPVAPAAQAAAAPQGPIGYTEAEIQAQLNKQYQQ